jgi:exosortase
VAYRALLWAEPAASLPAEIEEWFFLPSESTSPAVVAMSVWLLYRRRARLRGLAAAPGSPALGVGLLLAALGVYLWAIYVQAPDLQVPSLMLLSVAVAWLWGGAAAVRAVRLPVAVLLFAMPLPAPLFNELVFRLQMGTTALAGRVLYALGIPHFVAGEQIQRAEAVFSVIESCSGVRSMETLTLVSLLMADLFRRPPLHAWLLVLAAPPVGFLLNGLRAVLLILNPHSTVAEVHALQGIAILLGGLLLLFFWDGALAWLLRRAGRAPTQAPEPAAPRAPGARPAGLAAATLLACAAASFWLPRWTDRDDPVSLGSVKPLLRAALGPYQELEVDDVFLGSVRFRESVAASFGAPDGPVVLFLGVGNREQRAWSALSPKAGLPGTGWRVEREGWTRLAPDDRSVRQRLFRVESRTYLFLDWYEGRGNLPSEALRSLVAWDRSPWGRSGPILALRLGVPLRGPSSDDLEAAATTLREFYARLRPALDQIPPVWRHTRPAATTSSTAREPGRRGVAARPRDTRPGRGATDGKYLPDFAQEGKGFPLRARVAGGQNRAKSGA